MSGRSFGSAAGRVKLRPTGAACCGPDVRLRQRGADARER